MAMIKKLAEYHDEDPETSVHTTASDLRAMLFEKDIADCYLAYEGKDAVGYAMVFNTFDLNLGEPGMHLEDLFFLKSCRGKGYGQIMMQFLNEECSRKGYKILNWVCGDYNKSGLRFYKQLGATINSKDVLRWEHDTNVYARL